jgi:lipopolysaccharide transport system permease protein
VSLETLPGINFFAANNQLFLIAALSVLVIFLLAWRYYIIARNTADKTETSDYTDKPTSKPRLVIEAGRADRQYWKDLWNYRELFYFLAWRDILVRYKQTAIGVVWALIRPLLTMIIFTIIFGKLAKLPSNDVPYPIMVFAAMLPWQFFANALSECSNSLISNSNLVSKVFFPRLIVPTSAVVVSFIDFLISSVILVALMIWYKFVPTWGMLMLPPLILLAFAAALGGGLWFAALNIKYRDFRFIVPFVVQFGLYVSPVGFSSAIVPEKWRLLYSLNPMVGVIDGFRWAILGQDTLIYWQGFTLSIGIVCFLLISGIWYFRKTERTFADII